MLVSPCFKILPNRYLDKCRFIYLPWCIFDYFKLTAHHQAKWVTLIYSYAGFRLACRSPLCRYVAWSLLAVSWFTALSSHTSGLSPSGIASELNWVNCMRSASVGKAAMLSIYCENAGCCLVIPLQQVVLAHLNKYYHQSGRQCGERQASLKAALHPITDFNIFQNAQGPFKYIYWCTHAWTTTTTNA